MIPTTTHVVHRLDPVDCPYGPVQAACAEGVTTGQDLGSLSENHHADGAVQGRGVYADGLRILHIIGCFLSNYKSLVQIRELQARTHLLPPDRRDLLSHGPVIGD